jgi:hypothetical protein
MNPANAMSRSCTARGFCGTEALGAGTPCGPDQACDGNGSCIAIAHILINEIPPGLGESVQQHDRAGPSAGHDVVDTHPGLDVDDAVHQEL